MKMLEKGKDKIQQICTMLREDTLQPAIEESSHIIERAKEEANAIIAEAERKAKEHAAAFKKDIEKEREVFLASLKESSKQSIDALKQAIESKLFNETLAETINQTTVNPKIIEQLITVIVEAVEKEGISSDLSAIVPKKVDPAAVNALLKDKILKKLQENGVILSDFAGGVKVKLHDKKITIDMSDEAIISLLDKYLRKDFRKWLFKG